MVRWEKQHRRGRRGGARHEKAAIQFSGDPDLFPAVPGCPAAGLDHRRMDDPARLLCLPLLPGRSAVLCAAVRPCAGPRGFRPFPGQYAAAPGDRPTAGGEVRQPDAAGRHSTDGGGLRHPAMRVLPRLRPAGGQRHCVHADYAGLPGGHEGRPHPPDADPGSGPVSGAGGVRHGGPRDNVANFMHLVGGVTGTVFGVVLAKRR